MLDKEQMREYQRARREKKGSYLDLTKDLSLNMSDLGITGWNEDGIFIKPEITVEQVRNIARLVHAKHGRECPAFYGG